MRETIDNYRFIFSFYLCRKGLWDWFGANKAGIAFPNSPSLKFDVSILYPDNTTAQTQFGVWILWYVGPKSYLIIQHSIYLREWKRFITDSRPIIILTNFQVPHWTSWTTMLLLRSCKNRDLCPMAAKYGSLFLGFEGQGSKGYILGIFFNLRLSHLWQSRCACSYVEAAQKPTFFALYSRPEEKLVPGGGISPVPLELKIPLPGNFANFKWHWQKIDSHPRDIKIPPRTSGGWMQHWAHGSGGKFGGFF